MVLRTTRPQRLVFDPDHTAPTARALDHTAPTARSMDHTAPTVRALDHCPTWLETFHTDTRRQAVLVRAGPVSVVLRCVDGFQRAKHIGNFAKLGPSLVKHIMQGLGSILLLFILSTVQKLNKQTKPATTNKNNKIKTAITTKQK